MPRHTDRKPGYEARKRKAAEKKAREQAAAKRGQQMTVGKGGILVKDGGKVTGQFPDGSRAFQFGGLGDDAFGFIVAGEPGKLNLLDCYRIAPSLPDLPNGANVVRALGGDFFVAKGIQGALLGAGPQGELSAAEVLCTVDGGVLIDGTTHGVKIVHSTTGASANCFIDPSDSRIWRSTSSLRYKQDVTDLDVDPAAVLKMQPRTWRDKSEVEQDADTETHYVGFIAEELHDLGLTQFVVYDGDGEPEAIAYDRLSAALVTVAQDQQRQIDALAERLDALESREG